MVTGKLSKMGRGGCLFYSGLELPKAGVWGQRDVNPLPIKNIFIVRKRESPLKTAIVNSH